MRQGSAPNFCPPTEEGVVIQVEDEEGEVSSLEFLGLIIHNDRKYGFFFPVTEDEPALSSGEVLVLDVTDEAARSALPRQRHRVVRMKAGGVSCGPCRHGSNGHPSPMTAYRRGGTRS